MQHMQGNRTDKTTDRIVRISRIFFLRSNMGILFFPTVFSGMLKRCERCDVLFLSYYVIIIYEYASLFLEMRRDARDAIGNRTDWILSTVITGNFD
jgi:hypothetical protein